MLLQTNNLCIHSMSPLLTPASLLDEIKITEEAAEIITDARKQIEQIITKKDDRLLIVVGPCSIHDIDAALEYGTKLQKESIKHKNELCIVMRVYFEKPRTTIGWKGLINDPDMNDSFNIEKGLRIGRSVQYLAPM